MNRQNNILAYRKKHPRCRYCKFKKHIFVLEPQYSYDKCMLKDIPLKEWYFLLWRWQGCFCRWFKPQREDEDY